MRKFLLCSLIILVSQMSFAFDTKAKYAILMDYDTGTVLFDKKAYVQMAPSSMSKMMTAYIAFEQLKAGNVKLEDKFPISERAWRMGGTRMFIPLNARVSFEDLIKGLLVQSGNDAAVSIAEILMGSEEEFTYKMNEVAQNIGMKNSNFTNATGWPDKNNYSCAYDLAILALNIIKEFPEYYGYFSQTEFTFNGIRQVNNNGLLYRNIGADGLKTGYAEDAGYGLTGSVKRGDRRLIAVVNGLATTKERTMVAESLMKYGMMNFTKVVLARKDQVIEKIKVSNGKSKEVELVSAEDIILIVPRREEKQIKTTLNYNTPVISPVQANDEIGSLVVESSSIGSQTYPLVAKTTIEKANIFDRIQNNLSRLFD
jgi:serine-type D-Ala-D-Ala carboxypeptidase (penicillin-binding protein 5/6)